MKLMPTAALLLLLPAATAADPLAAFDQILQVDPNHHGARYYAARSAARMGDLPRALRYLRALEQSSFDDAIEVRDFPALQGQPEFQQIADALSTRAKQTGQIHEDMETRCGDVLPEGTAYDAQRKELLISSGHRRNVIALSADGQCREVVQGGPQGLLAVLGMHLDRNPNHLWVANTHAPFMRDANDAAAGSAQISLIDLQAGRVIAHYPLPAKGIANDITVLVNGDVLVTESIGGAVYRWQASTQKFVTEWPDNSFEGPNGIVAIDATAETDVVIADFHGLWLARHNPDGTHSKVKLQTPGNRYMGGIDGLTRANNEIIAIQNLAGRGQVWRFRIDRQQQRITDLSLRLRNHPDLWNPTTGAFDGERFWFVADPELQQNNTATPKPLPAGRSGHRVLSLNLR